VSVYITKTRLSTEFFDFFGANFSFSRFRMKSLEISRFQISNFSTDFLPLRADF